MSFTKKLNKNLLKKKLRTRHVFLNRNMTSFVVSLHFVLHKCEEKKKEIIFLLIFFCLVSHMKKKNFLFLN